MTDAAGPIFTGGFEPPLSADGGIYSILYLPDKHNDQLQREGKAPVYYWMPNSVRLARKGDTGDYMFHLIHFVGVLSSDTTVGASGTSEVAGGVLSLSTTAAPPASFLQQSQDQLLNRFRGNDDKYWGWRTPVAPMFRPMPITANITTITNLSPKGDGSVPAVTPGTTGPTGRSMASSQPRSIQLVNRPRFAPQPRTVPFGRAFRGPSNLDPWYWNLQGQGPGNIDPAGTNAYSGLVGSLPAAILWQGFHGVYSPIVVAQSLTLPVWAPAARLTIDGNWDRIFDHFSVAAQGRYLWFSADIKAEFNKMVIDGTITVDLEIDTTLPNADKLRDDMMKRSDLVYNKFMDEAQKAIFDPPPPDVKPAETQGGISSIFSPFSLSLSAKYRHDETHLNLHYSQQLDERYNQTQVISGDLEGFYNEIKADPQAEQKYFTTLYLEDWDRKVTRLVRAIANWPDQTKKWVGEPVSFLSVQIGYPSATGDIEWTAHVFQSTDAPDSHYEPAMAKKNATDVTNPPQGWTPDKTFVKRQVHFLEPPDETAYPFIHVFVEKNVVDLDAGVNGSLTNDNIIEVRADSAGKLDVGPITLNVDLDSAKQEVEVSFQAFGKTDAGADRNITKFSWTYADQSQPRYWAIYTGQLNFVPKYQYQVRVVVKGSIFTKGMEWVGPWVEGQGNGPLVVSVPTPDDPGVTKRSLIPGAPPVAEPVPVTGWTPVPVSTGPGSGTPPAATSGIGAGTPPPAIRRDTMPKDQAPTAGSVEEGNGRQEMELVSGWNILPPGPGKQ